MTHVSITAKGHSNGGNRRRRIKQMEIKKQIDDDSLMASSSGDVTWLEQTLRSNFKKALSQTKKQGFSTIHLAAMNGHLECLKILIEKQRVPVDLESGTGWRAVHLAINTKNKTRSLKCLMYLLQQGADPSKPNFNGFTPVHQAASTGHVNCLRALTDAGAAINTYDSDNLLPVDYARIWGHRMCVRILNARQWHIDKEDELRHRVKAEEESQQMQEELDRLNFEEKTHKVERCTTAFEQWLSSKGLSDTLECYEPFSVKVIDGRPSPKPKKSPSPVFPKVHTTGVIANSTTPELPLELKSLYHQYMDEFDEEKRLDLIPLANVSATKRRQRAQDTFWAMRDAGIQKS